MGKVWESGAVQVVQCADSLSDDSHPRNRLPGGRPRGLVGGSWSQFSAGAYQAGFVARQQLQCSCLMAKARLLRPTADSPPLPCRHRLTLPCANLVRHLLALPAGELTGRIAECIYLPVYDRTGQGALLHRDEMQLGVAVASVLHRLEERRVTVCCHTASEFPTPRCCCCCHMSTLHSLPPCCAHPCPPTLPQSAKAFWLWWSCWFAPRATTIWWWPMPSLASAAC